MEKYFWVSFEPTDAASSDFIGLNKFSYKEVHKLTLVRAKNKVYNGITFLKNVHLDSDLTFGLLLTPKQNDYDCLDWDNSTLKRGIQLHDFIPNSNTNLEKSVFQFRSNLICVGNYKTISRSARS